MVDVAEAPAEAGLVNHGYQRVMVATLAFPGRQANPFVARAIRGRPGPSSETSPPWPPPTAPRTVFLMGTGGVHVDPRFGDRLRQPRAERGLSLRDLATLVHHGKSYVHELESGQKVAPADVAQRLDEALDARGSLLCLAARPAVVPVVVDEEGAELDALELARRVAASDVGTETIERLEAGADVMAMAYATTPPAELLPRVVRHLAYLCRLIDARKTLAQHRRLLVVGGWLSLL